MSAGATPQSNRARLFIVEFDLTELSGHHFNQVLGFKLAAEQQGLAPRILLARNVDASLAALLDGERVIEPNIDQLVRDECGLDVFPEVDRRLRPLWDDIEQMAVSRADMVMITSARPAVIYSLGAWLGRLAAEKRPAVFFRFFDHDYLDRETMALNENGTMLRFASRDLSLRPGQERIFFTLNNESMRSALTCTCRRRVFLMPIPKYYGELFEPTARDDGVRVYVHLNERSGVLIGQIQSIIRAVLDRHPDTKFQLKYCLNASQADTPPALDGDLAARGVELLASEQSAPAHLATIAASDIVLLPYEAVRYQVLMSGVFAEAAAFGKVLVYPNATSMAEQVAAGLATGIGFDEPTQCAVCAALLRALDSLPQLAASAARQSAAFRQENSSVRNVELMQTLAQRDHDMRPRYVAGTTIDFSNRLRSRCYMERGWSVTETIGTWTDGPEAVLCLCLEAIPTGPLSAHIRLSPLVCEDHSQQVDIAINGHHLCTWNLPAPDENYPAWRVLAIPPDVAASGEIELRFGIKSPTAPRQLGISQDQRKLGILLHEISIAAIG